MMSGVDIVHDEELSKEQAGVAAPSVQDSQSNTDEKVATDPKNSTEGCEEAVVHEEGLEKETTKEQVTDQSLQLVSDSGQYQIGWKLTVVDASRLFVDVVCYGTLNCYSQILLKFLRACEHYSEHRRDAIKEIADVTEEQNKTTQGDSQCQEARDEIESPIDFTINPVSTITIPSLPSLEGDGDHFCINHEHFLYNEGFASLDKLRRNGILCDVELSVGDHSSIAAHKVVLASVIPYFEAMFTTEMVELKKRKIIIRSIEYEILELLVNYAYCGRLHLNAKNVVKVMFAANFFQLDNVTEKCGEYLLRRLHPSNVLGIRAYCSALNCSITVEKIDRFIEKYFTLICRSEEFLQVSVDDLVCVLSINGLYVEGEEKVFEAALAWIEHAPDERKVFASRVLACVRLKALSPSFLAVTVGRHPLIRDDTKCRELVDDAKDYHLVPAERSSTPSVDVQPRICHELPCIIFAFGGKSSENVALSKVEKYDPLTRQWVPILPMPSERSEVGVAVCNGKVYVVGGFNDDFSALVEFFDYTLNSWTEVASIPQSTSSVSAVFLGDNLYVCGGECKYGVTNAVHVFHRQENRWASGVSMLTKRYFAAVAVLDGCIYIMGGSDGTSSLSSVERFSPDVGEWEKVTAMQSQRSSCAAAVLNGKIYVCGGENGPEYLDSVECFDPKVNRWFSVAPMKVVRSALSVVAYDNAIYAIAGKNDTSSLASVEVYYEDTNEWEFAAYLTSARSYLGTAVVPISPSMLNA